ncbi:MAG TPA: prepilin-type N-terminal cleavage/methylation domain-containing protein [Mycobacteriales bacterium]|nr:prepilin-type N-terminal cleavage/methylation domain-containing protein [Mycobacteriales bacterium]
MRTRIQRLLVHRDEQGFTLIELLIVIVIIGILAAIAIPAFVAQRSKGYDAAAKSDVRDLANFEEIYLTDFGEYGSLADVLANEPRISASHGVTLTVVSYEGATGYCLSAHHPISKYTWYYDPQAGGLQPPGSTGCPVSTTGLPGGSITG